MPEVEATWKKAAYSIKRKNRQFKLYNPQENYKPPPKMTFLSVDGISTISAQTWTKPLPLNRFFRMRTPDSEYSTKSFPTTRTQERKNTANDGLMQLDSWMHVWAEYMTWFGYVFLPDGCGKFHSEAEHKHRKSKYPVFFHISLSTNTHK